MIKIRKGLDLPIAGAPVQAIQDGPNIQHVALLGEEYVGMRPSMLVQEGDTVKKGRALFEDKKTPFLHGSASGRIAAINRGERRVLQSVVIALENGGDDQLEFAHYPLGELAQLPREQVESELIASGLWTALRTRPFSKTPSPGSEARAIFVTAMDTQPLAADPQVIIAEQQAAFNAGLLVLARLTTGGTRMPRRRRLRWPAEQPADRLQRICRPAPRRAGGYAHSLPEPVSLKKTVWHIGYGTSSPSVRCSPPVSSIPAGSWRWPGRRWRSRRCCALARGQPRGADRRPPERRREPGDLRFGAERHARRRPECPARPFPLAGVGAGRRARQRAVRLDRAFAEQVLHYPHHAGALPEEQTVRLLDQHPRRRARHGADRQLRAGDAAGHLPTLLLRDLLAGDSDSAQALGCLELDEEDLALCTFVCPGKYEYAPVLREVLTKIEQEG